MRLTKDVSGKYTVLNPCTVYTQDLALSSHTQPIMSSFIHFCAPPHAAPPRSNIAGLDVVGIGCEQIIRERKVIVVVTRRQPRVSRPAVGPPQREHPCRRREEPTLHPSRVGVACMTLV